MIKLKKGELDINFVNLDCEIFIEDSIRVNRYGVNTNYTMHKIPDYTCGLYLMWNDPLLDYKLPDFIGFGGSIMTGKEIRERIQKDSEDDVYFFRPGEYNVKVEDIMDSKNDEERYLLYNMNVEYSDNQIVTGKYVFWHLQDLDRVLHDRNELLDYINGLPEKIKALRYMPPIQ